MSNVFEADAGENIYQAIVRVKLSLQNWGFSFGYLTLNDTQMIISVDSNPYDIATIYNLKRRLARHEQI